MGKSKGTGKFWIGKGCLGKDIHHGDEIPEGCLTPERMDKFEKAGWIGEKFKPVDPDENAILKKRIAELEKEAEKDSPDKKGKGK